MKSLLSAPHPRELGQSFDRDSSQRSTMLSAKCSRRILIGHRDMTSSPSTREWVHRGDIHRGASHGATIPQELPAGSHEWRPPWFGVRVKAK